MLESLLDTPSVLQDDDWYEDLESSLQHRSKAWVSFVNSGGFSQDQAWVLLSWVERSANRIGETGSSKVAKLACFAISLLDEGPLDLRDIMVVASLIRRSCVYHSLDFRSIAIEGTKLAGPLGAKTLEWLLKVPDTISSLHKEITTGDGIRFERMPQNLNLDGVMRWADGKPR